MALACLRRDASLEVSAQTFVHTKRFEALR